MLKVKTGLINFIDHTLRLFFRPDQSGMSKVEAAVNTLRYVRLTLSLPYFFCFIFLFHDTVT